MCGFGRVVRPWAAGAKATCAACAVEEHPACVHCGLDAPIPPPGAAACCSRCAEGRTAACVDCGTLTVMSGRNRQTRCSRCYRRPERRCGRCGRLGAIARLATGDDPDLCRNCWTGPVMACEACGGVRPCRGERNGTMLCAGCRPRPKRPCAYCGNRRTVTIVWAAGPACSSCYRAFCRAKGDCPRCGAHRRLLPYKGFDESLCAACARVAPDPICESCGNEDWLYERGRCARCVLVARLETLLGDHASRHARGLELSVRRSRRHRAARVHTWLAPFHPARGQAARPACQRGAVIGPRSARRPRPDQQRGQQSPASPRRSWCPPGPRLRVRPARTPASWVPRHRRGHPAPPAP